MVFWTPRLFNIMVDIIFFNVVKILWRTLVQYLRLFAPQRTVPLIDASAFHNIASVGSRLRDLFDLQCSVNQLTILPGLLLVPD